LDRRHHVLERLPKELKRVLLGTALHPVERVIHDTFSNRLLALPHDGVHELGNHDVAVLRVGVDLAFLGSVTARHASRSCPRSSRRLRPPAPAHPVWT